MTKREIAGKVAEKIGVTQLITLKVIDGVLEAITETLAGGGLNLGILAYLKLKVEKSV